MDGQKQGIPVATVVTKSPKGVSFNETVQVVTLPHEEAVDAWRARFGPWRSAPTHDTLWCGFEQGFRDREISMKELKRVLYEARVKRILPRPFAHALLRRRKSQTVFASENNDGGVEKPKKRLSILRRMSLSRSESSKSKQPSGDANSNPVRVVVVDDKQSNSASSQQQPQEQAESQVSDDSEDDKLSQPRRISDLESYFEQVERMDGLRKSGVPRRNYSWTEELVKLTIEWLRGDMADEDSLSGQSDNENEPEGAWQYLSLSWILRKVRRPSNEFQNAKGTRRSSDDSEASTSFDATPPASPRPSQSTQTTTIPPASGKRSSMPRRKTKSKPSNKSTPKKPASPVGGSKVEHKREPKSPLQIAGKQLIEDLYDLAVRLSGLDDL